MGTTGRTGPAGAEPLSHQDVELLRLLAQGLPLGSVARRMRTSERTDRRRTRAICNRLGVSACLLFALVAVLMLNSAQATGAKRQQTDCTWGASSIRAEIVDGKFVVSPPATSGCIPH